MTTGTTLKPLSRESSREAEGIGCRITVFYCFNAFPDVNGQGDDLEVRSISMPCSGMTRGVVLLKAFEAGADAVVVLGCPEGTCHYLQGNLRARKRVAAIKKLLDEIGLDGHRLNFFNVTPGDRTAIEHIIRQTVAELETLGPSPAR
jgi:F420-non-reducing hydrogenase iron-sulfur subunit